MTESASANTDRLLWRDKHEVGDYYADSVSVTEGGGIAIQSGGTVVVLTARAWIDIARSVITAPAASADARAAPGTGLSPHDGRIVPQSTEA
jgi:hypothetical protein